MAQSITQRIIQAVVDVLTNAAPQGTNVKKGRKTPVNESALPLVQVYWHIENTHGVGNPRRPMLMTRNLVLEIKFSVAGDDEEFDAGRQWIVAALWNADTLGGLIKNITEAETVPCLEDSSVNQTITAGAIRYAVEYTTLPGDITSGN